MVYFMGLDVGSTASKCVIMNDDEKVIADAVITVGAGTSGPGRAVEGALTAAGLTQDDIAVTAATGYGRNAIGFAALTVSELSCHARGAVWLQPAVRTVIDIGGQDAKALAITPDGRLDRFVMNDKCAAGTGRFLEVMARILETEPSEMGGLDAQSQKRIEISSTCTVFAESEVISQLSSGVEICDIIAGIHRSVATRAASLAKRLGTVPPVLMTGGVARNGGVVRALASALDIPVLTDERSQLAGAIGAALFARERYGKSIV